MGTIRLTTEEYLQTRKAAHMTQDILNNQEITVEELRSLRSFVWELKSLGIKQIVQPLGAAIDVEDQGTAKVLLQVLRDLLGDDDPEYTYWSALMHFTFPTT